MALEKMGDRSWMLPFNTSKSNDTSDEEEIQKACPKCGHVSPKGQLICPYCWLIFETGEVWDPMKKKRRK